MSIWYCPEHGLTAPQACCQRAAVTALKSPVGQQTNAAYCLSCTEKDAAIRELCGALENTAKLAMAARDWYGEWVGNQEYDKEIEDAEWEFFFPLGEAIKRHKALIAKYRKD